jgi:hypothetical protein
MENFIMESSFDSAAEELTIHSIKHVQTHTVLSSEQIRAFYNKLNHENENIIISINDQFPILLTPEQVDQLKAQLVYYIKP